jgi:hypothetical protein
MVKMTPLLMLWTMMTDTMPLLQIPPPKVRDEDRDASTRCMDKSF